METLLIGFGPFAVFFFLMAFAKKRNCPECGEPLANFQSPFTKTRRQWLNGGYRCTNCNSEVDRSGVLVERNAPPTDLSPIWIGTVVIVLGFVMPIAVAIVMFNLVSHAS